MKTLILFGALAAVVVAGVHSEEKTFSRNLQAMPGGTLTLRTDIGSVEITGVEGSTEVSVRVVVRGRKRDVDNFDIAASTTATGVEIQGRSPRTGRWWRFGDDDLDAVFTLQVPASYNIDARTSGGDIRIKNLKGKIEGETSGGVISLSDVVGPVDLETSGGDIRAERLEGSFRLQTSGGTIRLSDVKGDVDVSTSGGDIVLRSVDGTLRATTSGGNVTILVDKLFKGIYAETSGGDIDIAVPPEVKATLDAATSGGEVTCDLPLTVSGRFSETRVRGTVNGGGPTLYAHTSGGDVRIRTQTKR